jgi:hypothetical protein
MARCYPPLSACRTSWLSQYPLQSHTLWGDCTRAHFPTGARTKSLGGRGCSSYGNHGYLYPPTTVLVKQVFLPTTNPFDIMHLEHRKSHSLPGDHKSRGRHHDSHSFPTISQQDCKSERCLTMPYSFLTSSPAIALN